MNVKVDTKVLLEKLEEHNPGIDLTGVKAYLFDLMVGDDSDDFEVASRQARNRAANAAAVQTALKSEVQAAQQEAEEITDAAIEKAALDQVFGFDTSTIPDEAPPRVTAPRASKPAVTISKPMTKPSPAEERQRREAARAKSTTAQFAGKSGKENAEMLSSDMLPKKPAGSKQFVEMGETSSPSSRRESSGDLELG